MNLLKKKKLARQTILETNIEHRFGKLPFRSKIEVKKYIEKAASRNISSYDREI